jgi:hypothetical protein
MSGSDWRTIIAVGLILSGLFTGWGWLQFSKYQTQHSNERQYIANYEAPTGGNYADSCREKGSGISGAAKCLIESIDSNREAQRSKYDLQAQQEMAEWAFALVLLTVAQAVASFFGIILLVQNLALARVANANTLVAITQEQINAERQLRAYITISHVDFVQIGREIQIRVKILNAGQTPAHSCVVWMDSSLWSIPLINDAFPNHVIHEGVRPSRSIIGPGTDSNIERFIQLTEDEYIEQEQPAQTRMQIIISHGEVRYQDVFRKPHFTRFKGAIQLTRHNRWIWAPTHDNNFTDDDQPNP